MYKSNILLALSIWLYGFTIYGQADLNFNTYQDRAFVKNEGQFDGRNWQDTPIIYGYNQNPFYVFFTNKGLTYRFDKIIKDKKHKEGDTIHPKRSNISELIQVEWLNCNENVKISASDETSAYFSYAVKKNNEVINHNHLKGYKKLTYHNLYDHIDVEYYLHPEKGIKYNLILHPGADLSNVKLKYIGQHTNTEGEFITISLNSKHELEINTSLGQIIELPPVSFYNATKTPLKSSYLLENNILSFNIENYDSTKEIIIDPWIISPPFQTSTAVWEVETDGIGNVYVIGGETPMELKKYNAAGVLQWNYITPWDTNSVWLGTLATDNLGTSYITSGTSPEIERIDNAGNLVWHNNNGGFSVEYWTITFNCDKTKLIVGGTKGINFFPLQLAAAIYEIDVSNGNVINTVITDINPVGFSTPIEVRSISSTKNARYAYLTHNDIGTINQNLGSCPTNEPYYQVDNGHHLAYKCENYLPATQNGGGLKALIANDNFIYTNSGDQIHQRDLNTGALVNSVNLPGGNSTTTILGGIVVSNSGLDVDDCGNVYAGSGDRVVKFDQNLNILAQTNTTFTIYDVDVNFNGEVIAVGAQSDNSLNGNRNGRIESINLSACAQFALICCDANVCPVDTMCVTDPSVLMVPNTPGGTWSGPGVDALGNFNPAVAGVGTHTITYTLTCGTSSFNIVVNSCATLTACIETNGDVTVSGGSGPYTWESWEIVGQTCTGTVLFGSCVGGSWVDDYGWVIFGGNSSTETPPNSTSQIQISESGGSSVIISDVSTLPPCSTTCDATITPAGPFCENDPAVNLTAATAGGTWSGNGITDANLGTFDPATAGAGSHTITYTIGGACGAIDTETIEVSAIDNPLITEIGPFCLSNDTIVLTANIPGGIWSGNGITDSLTGEFGIGVAGIGSHEIVYTTTGLCADSDTLIIEIYSQTIASISPISDTIDYGSSINLIATGGGTYSWSPDDDLSCSDCNNPNASPIESTTYCVVVDNNNCLDTACTTIFVEYNCGEVFVPNAFSPNGDASNNLECVYGNCLKSIDLRIYDRWGELVYQTTDLNGCWDGTYKGKLLSSQVFVYLLDATLVTGEIVNKKGNISLIR